VDHKEIFRKACIVQFHSSVWQCTKMLDHSVMERVGENADWLKGRKYLIDPQLIGPCRSVVQLARKMLNQFALPFPIVSLYLVPKESMSKVEQRLQHLKELFWERYREFESKYDQSLMDARYNLGELFSDADYPINLETKFNFEWRYLALGFPIKASLVTPELYEREKQKFHELMEETRNTAMTALREELGGIVSHLVDRLTNNNGKPKKINEGMFNRLKDFLNDVEARNIFDDDQLIELAQEAKNVIGGVSPLGLKDNHGLRMEITNQMNSLKHAVEASIEDLPTRQIRIAKVVDIDEQEQEEAAA
jgi:hypothetical protein